MFVDFAIVLPIIFGGLLGFRDGSVRKLVSIAVTLGAMFVAKFFMYDLGGVMQKELHTDSSWAPLHAYLIIFFCILFLQSMLYRFMTGNYKIGGIADRIGGAALGVVHTALVISVMLTIFAIKNIPGEKAVKESRAYEPVRNVSSELLNLVTQTVPQVSDTIEKLKEQGVGVSADDSGKTASEKIREMLDKEVKEQSQEAMKQLPTARDSISKLQKRQ